jgi:hypothetical protein
MSLEYFSAMATASTSPPATMENETLTDRRPHLDRWTSRASSLFSGENHNTAIEPAYVAGRIR